MKLMNGQQATSMFARIWPTLPLLMLLSIDEWSMQQHDFRSNAIEWCMNAICLTKSDDHHCCLWCHNSRRENHSIHLDGEFIQLRWQCCCCIRIESALWCDKPFWLPFQSLQRFDFDVIFRWPVTLEVTPMPFILVEGRLFFNVVEVSVKQKLSKRPINRIWLDGATVVLALFSCCIAARFSLLMTCTRTLSESGIFQEMKRINYCDIRDDVEFTELNNIWIILGKCLFKMATIWKSHQNRSL